MSNHRCRYSPGSVPDQQTISLTKKTYAKDLANNRFSKVVLIYILILPKESNIDLIPSPTWILAAGKQLPARLVTAHLFERTTALGLNDDDVMQRYQAEYRYECEPYYRYQPTTNRKIPKYFGRRIR